MNRKLRPASALLLVLLLLLSQAGHVQGTLKVTADTANNKINFATDKLTFYFWYGFPQSLVYINPTFAWLDNEQPSVLYVVDLMGLLQYNPTQMDNAFQRNETVPQNGTFSWIGNEAWSSNVVNFTNPVAYSYLNFTLNAITSPRASNFTYLPGNLTLHPTIYGADSVQKFYSYGYAATQSSTDIFFNMTRWRWSANSTTSNLALMLGFYALNMTVIQKLGINLVDYIVPDYNFISSEDLKARYAPLDPSAFILTGMNLIGGNGTTSAGGHYDLTGNETAIYPPIYEHPLPYTLPNPTSTTNMPFIRLQFTSGNTTLPGYFSFPGYAFGLDSSGGKTPLNVAASYVSTGNFARIFLSYPFFGTDQLRHFFSFGVDDNYLPASPSPAQVYIVLPSLPYQQALIIAGIAVVSMGVALFATRMARREA